VTGRESSAESVRFGVFEANLRTGELRRNGSRVKLQDQPFQVLALLLKQPGEVVTREELRARLWPANTFVDFDHGVNAAIKRLRDALGDSAENPRFVETLARRGYRFVGPVTRNGADSDNSAPVPEAARKAARQLGARHLVALGLAIAAILIIGTYTGFRAGHRSAASVRSAERRLTSNPENDPLIGAAISPDGRYVAFADRSGFFLRVISSGETHPIALPEWLKAGYVSWFPDGSHILLTRTAPASEKPSLWSVSIFGGMPLKLADNAERGTVSPDGSRIVFLRSEYGREEVWQMQSDGQQPRKILGQPGDHFVSVVWSPDSRHIAFLRTAYMHGWKEMDGSLGIGDIVTGRAKYVLSSPRLHGALAWAADGRLIYSLEEAPPSQNDSNLWAMRVDTRGTQMRAEPSRLTSGPDAKETAGVSADGRHLLFLRRVDSPEVYVAEIRPDATGLQARRLNLEEHCNVPFAWTPDGKSVIFVSDRDGPMHIFKQAVDQPVPDLLVGGAKNLVGGRLTPDGSSILYLQLPSPGDTDQRIRLMRLALSGGTPQPVLVELGITNLQCARAPHAVCMFSKSSGGSLVFLTFDPVSGKENEFTRITDQEWYSYNWSLSPDGSTLAFSKKDRTEDPGAIRMLPVAGGAERTLSVQPWSGISYIDWATDSRSLWVHAVSPAGAETLLNVDLRGNAKPVLQESEMRLGWAIPSPDSRHLAIWQAAESSNAWLLENF